eukprot:Sdes_comp18943_c0_seq6m9440
MNASMFHLSSVFEQLPLLRTQLLPQVFDTRISASIQPELSTLPFLYNNYILNWFPVFLIHGFGTFLVSQFAFLLFNLPYTYLDRMRPKWAQKYKIQPESLAYQELKSCLWTVFLNHFCFLLPLNLTIFPITCFLRKIPVEINQEMLSSLLSPKTMLLHILICLVIEDVYSYTTHRWSHINSWLYKYTHRHHHHYHAPISWSATATHPAEFLIQNIIPSTLGNLLLGKSIPISNLHPTFHPHLPIISLQAPTLSPCGSLSLFVFISQWRHIQATPFPGPLTI